MASSSNYSDDTDQDAVVELENTKSADDLIVGLKNLQLGDHQYQTYDFDYGNMIEMVDALLDTLHVVRIPHCDTDNAVLCRKDGLHFYARIVHRNDIYSKKNRSGAADIVWTRLLTHLKIHLQNLKNEKAMKLITVRSLYYIMGNDVQLEGININDYTIKIYIDRLCCFWGCTRRSLGIYASDSRSSFTGNIILTRRSRNMVSEVDLSMLHQPNTIYFSNVVSVKPSACPPKFILVVERMTVLDELISYHFTDRYPCIIITGGGEPSVDCRSFVHLVYFSLNIPIFALVDANPYGLEIYKTFKYGSFGMSFMNYDLVVPIKLLGLFESDLKKHGIHETDMKSMTKKDLQKTRTLSLQDWVKLEPEVDEALLYYLSIGKKADLEILSLKNGVGFLVDYLEEKIMPLLNVAS